MPVNLCVTVCKRQDLLPWCLASACAGTVRPDKVYLVDQANRPDLLAPALTQLSCPYEVVYLGEAKRGGEADAVNWYLRNVPQERVIAHEDVVFGPDSLERFLAVAAPFAPFVIDASQGVLAYRDPCVFINPWMGGLYDEKMSPNFYLYVDVDYEDRLAHAGIHPTVVDCGITHLKNGTLKAIPDEARAEHGRLAERARAYYERVWGRPVTEGGDTIGRAAWRRSHMDEVVAWRKLEE